jgi:osmotically-inducible protein OsmY
MARSTNGKHMSGRRPSDRDVKAAVVDRLRENPYTYGARIRVRVTGGVVMLGGEVDTPLAKAVALDDAGIVPGVLEVADALIVRAA